MSGINTIGGVSQSLATESIKPTAVKPAGGNFMHFIDDLLGKVNAEQINADQVTNDLATGKTDNLHGVMLAVAKADLSFRMFLEIRNRLTDAFQEIMRMQV